MDLNSSWIDKISHNPVTGILSVEVLGGTIYDYHGVDTKVYLDFIGAESNGKYHNNYIRNNYKYDIR